MMHNNENADRNGASKGACCGGRSQAATTTPGIAITIITHMPP
jgi:hypothetical protein